jgi:protein-tyrosine phosphatase
VVDLRNDDERGDDLAPRPSGVTTVHVPIDDVSDAELWARLSQVDGTPLYFEPSLAAMGNRLVA